MNNASVRINANDIIYVEIEPIGHRKTKIVTEEKTYISFLTKLFFGKSI